MGYLFPQNSFKEGLTRMNQIEVYLRKNLFAKVNRSLKIKKNTLNLYMQGWHKRKKRTVLENSSAILDINYVDFLQFQRYFTPQAELEEAFIYIIHKPIDFSIDFSCRLKT